MSEINFITIPATEWENLKTELKFIATGILEIKQKNAKEFLTFKELQQKLKCSRNTAQNYINAGKIVGIEMNSGIYKKLLFRNADIDYFLNNEKRK
jgi:transcriptional antiterminator